jgi:hypothetical protein
VDITPPPVGRPEILSSVEQSLSENRDSDGDVSPATRYFRQSGFHIPQMLVEPKIAASVNGRKQGLSECVFLRRLPACHCS